MNRGQKQDVVSQLQQELASVPSVILTDFTGLNVEATQKLRAEFREAGVTYRVIKNTLMARAVKDSTLEAMSEFLQGPTSFAWSADDPVAAARVVVSFIKENKKLKIKGGLLDGNQLDVAGVEALADMPSRDELQMMVVAQALSPGRNLAGQLVSSGQKVAGAVKALVDKLEDAA